MSGKVGESASGMNIVAKKRLIVFVTSLTGVLIGQGLIKMNAVAFFMSILVSQIASERMRMTL